MSAVEARTVTIPPALDGATIRSRLATCPRLPSLRSIDSALRELLHADQRYTEQIAEVIRHDPSLTSRVLRLVNSLYFGLANPVTNLEDAVLYLGPRHIRQLVMVTPILEDFQKLTARIKFDWRGLWQHCIGTAILAREIISHIETPEDETDYVAGLVHDVGKIVIAHAFPEHFQTIYHVVETSSETLVELERSILGMDHGEVGALYLSHYKLPAALVEAARFHHDTEFACENARVVAAVQSADLLMRHAKIGKSGATAEVPEEEWSNLKAWNVLFPDNQEERTATQTAVRKNLTRLPLLLDGMI